MKKKTMKLMIPTTKLNKYLNKINSKFKKTNNNQKQSKISKTFNYPIIILDNNPTKINLQVIFQKKLKKQFYNYIEKVNIPPILPTNMNYLLSQK